MAPAATIQQTILVVVRHVMFRLVVKTIRARLSTSAASAVDGDIGLKSGDGCTNSDRLADQPISTTRLCTAATAAATAAARVRSRSALAVLIDPPIRE